MRRARCAAAPFPARRRRRAMSTAPLAPDRDIRPSSIRTTYVQAEPWSPCLPAASSPHKMPVRPTTSWSESPSDTAHGSFVVELLGTRVHPGQRVTQPVPPVLPRVAVPGLGVAHLHAGVLEHVHHRPVGHDQLLVDAAG